MKYFCSFKAKRNAAEGWRTLNPFHSNPKTVRSTYFQLLQKSPLELISQLSVLYPPYRPSVSVFIFLYFFVNSNTMISPSTLRGTRYKGTEYSRVNIQELTSRRTNLTYYRRVYRRNAVVVRRDRGEGRSPRGEIKAGKGPYKNRIPRSS